MMRVASRAQVPGVTHLGDEIRGQAHGKSLYNVTEPASPTSPPTPAEGWKVGASSVNHVLVDPLFVIFSRFGLY